MEEGGWDTFQVPSPPVSTGEEEATSLLSDYLSTWRWGQSFGDCLETPGWVECSKGVTQEVWALIRHLWLHRARVEKNLPKVYWLTEST